MTEESDIFFSVAEIAVCFKKCDRILMVLIAGHDVKRDGYAILFFCGDQLFHVCLEKEIVTRKPYVVASLGLIGSKARALTSCQHQSRKLAAFQHLNACRYVFRTLFFALCHREGFNG